MTRWQIKFYTVVLYCLAVILDSLDKRTMYKDNTLGMVSDLLGEIESYTENIGEQR